jgi:predicted transcriptional regulator of viral defense system
MREPLTVRTGNLTTSLLRLTPDQERKLLSRLSRGGLIARVRQGLCLLPPQLPLGGVWTPEEALALNALMETEAGVIRSAARTPSAATDSTIKSPPASTPITTGSPEIEQLGQWC